MYLPICACFLLLAVSEIMQLQAEARMGHSKNVVTGYSLRQKVQKRSLIAIGKVLQSARFFMTTHRFSVYVKSGGAKQAELDFESINPTMLRDDTAIKVGKVGYRKVTLDLSKAHPSLTIWSRRVELGLTKDFEQIIMYGITD